MEMKKFTANEPEFPACPICGEVFEKVRRRHTVCSSKCRLKLYILRQAKKIEEEREQNNQK